MTAARTALTTACYAAAIIFAAISTLSLARPIKNGKALSSPRGGLCSQKSFTASRQMMMIQSVANRRGLVIPVRARSGRKKPTGFGGAPGGMGSPRNEKRPSTSGGNEKTTFKLRDDFEQAALGSSKSAEPAEELTFGSGLQVFLVLVFFAAIAFFGGFLLMDCLAFVERAGGIGQ
mmetsp:Transcript_32595/g.52805  ORF Transcript_32595/g.52805 Transcript_32595/m.52805 type:complete len:176 (+) Transcript_32595:219-746(+)|eukprot:jgi/Bigna1/90830/estExt_fgenesh1_pg.C_800085